MPTTEKEGHIRKGSVFKFVNREGGWFPFLTPEIVKADSAFKRLPGRQNKRHGTPWKKAHKLVKASRRRNRVNK